jgi:hypothetical protein
MLTKKYVKKGASQFQNFHVNIQNFIHSSVKDYQLGLATA